MITILSLSNLKPFMLPLCHCGVFPVNYHTTLFAHRKICVNLFYILYIGMLYLTFNIFYIHTALFIRICETKK